MQIAQVVPDLATFAVDDGFSYAVPDTLEVDVGSIVRVPLGNRRVRGYVVATRSGDTSGLKQVAAVSGSMPVFDARLLQTLRWAALHYVAPLSVLLTKTAPPNLPRRGPGEAWPATTRGRGSDLADAVRSGSRIQPAFVAGPAPWSKVTTELVGAATSTQRSALVVVPTVRDVERVGAGLRGEFGDRVALAWSSLGGAAVTAAWTEAATRPGAVVVGTREVVWWPVADLGVTVVFGEGRRGMKEPQTPTTHARDVLRRRGAVERFPVVSLGAVPTTETVATGVDVIEVPGRSWPLTEIVDRGEEPPGSGALTERARAGLKATQTRGGTGFILCRSRGEAVRCVKCQELRLCQVCDASIGALEHCPRCDASAGACVNCGGGRFAATGGSVARVIEEARSILGSAVGDASSGLPITVGTERDIPSPGAVDVAVVIDGDSAVYAANYRAGEEALRLLSRLAAAVKRGRANRAIVQTFRPDHSVYEALRHGSSLEFIKDELSQRSRDLFPPIGELMAVEIRNPLSTTQGELAEAVGASGQLLGPADLGDRQRWLIQGKDLRRTRVALRSAVQSWREGNAKVRIDADPIDL